MTSSELFQSFWEAVRAAAAIVNGVIQIALWKMNCRASKEDKKDSTTKHIECALKVILHDRIKWLGKTHIQNASITTEDLGDIIAMHRCYHDDLDGNGLLDNVMRQVKELPIRK